MSIPIPCDFCGERPSTEFTFGGELRPLVADDPRQEFARVFLPENPAGPQTERWFHVLGCRTWTTLMRDTRTNEIV